MFATHVCPEALIVHWYAMVSSSGKSTKKCIVLLIESKIAAILGCLKEEVPHKIADDFEIGILTVGDIKRNEAEILAFVSTMDKMAMSK